MSTPNRQEIDRVLQLRRIQRETAKACYPCHQRKVKCDGQLPCRTCRRRGHEHICAYDVDSTRSQHRQSSNHVNPIESGTPRTRSQVAEGHDPNDARRITEYQMPNPAVTQHSMRRPSESQMISHKINGDATASEYIYSGDNSVVSILRNRTNDENGSMAREVGSVLGLQNTYSNYPFMDIKSPQDRWNELLRIVPQRSEILKFFHFYRISAYPFNPILVDIERFELDLCTYLTAYAAGELRDVSTLSERWSTDRSLGHISLLLATLAAGAHYSDLEHPQRTELSQDFSRRSFQALRLANFLFRPSCDVVQTLLILGNTLQNNGQSDAAWALLGTTVRLAQTLGLHTERSVAHLPEHTQTKIKKLWFTTVWQDSLLSLCYDRVPVVSINGWSPDNAIFSRQNLTYLDVMQYLCRIALVLTTEQVIEGQELARALDMLETLDGVYIRAKPHLRSRQECKTLHHNLEHLALKMHISLSVSVLSRPALKRYESPNPQLDILRGRAKQSLIDASKAFLDFQALSIVPLRTWSMVHTVLSSTLLLCIWEETRNDAESRDLQQKVIEVFCFWWVQRMCGIGLREWAVAF